MTPRRGRQRPASQRLGLFLALGWAIALGGWPTLNLREAWAQAPRSPRVPAIYHKSRSFRIPFNVEPADRPRLKEVQLWVSEDSGFTWKTVSRTTPDRPSFTFRAARDAEFWFAVRTVDNRGVLYPAEEETVEPSMKVIVDTTPPTLLLESDGRRGSVAAVRWEVRDEHLDLKSLVVEYQVEGGRDFRKLPLRRLALIGSESWDAGTAEPLKVRGSVTDKAGNVAEASILISEGTPSNPAIGAGDDRAEYSPLPPVSSVSARQNAQSRDEFPDGAAADPFGPGYAGSATSRPSYVPGTPADSSPFGDPPGDPFGGPGATAETAATAPTGPEKPSSGGGQTLLVPSPRFPMLYKVDDAGPNGPATVELWVTQDGGRTWFRRGEDPDRASPFPVDLGGGGTFGLRLVARAASGLGDHPPAPGDPPFLWVEVDSTPPLLQLYPPVVGRGPANLGKVAILWRSSDVHLGNTPVTLSWRPIDAQGTEGTWHPITEPPIENTGKYIWSVPESVSPRFHVRIDVVDTVGNRSSAETSQGPPVLVDRTRPRSTIIGLDPSAMRGNPGFRPMR